MKQAPLTIEPICKATYEKPALIEFGELESLIKNADAGRYSSGDYLAAEEGL